MVGFDLFFHLRLDFLEIVWRNPVRKINIVIKTILYGRPCSELCLRPNLQDCGRKYVRRRMPEPFDIRHLRPHLRSFAFLIHEKPVKLTTMLTKDTKNLLAASARTGCHTIVTWQ